MVSANKQLGRWARTTTIGKFAVVPAWWNGPWHEKPLPLRLPALNYDPFVRDVGKNGPPGMAAGDFHGPMRRCECLISAICERLSHLVPSGVVALSDAEANVGCSSMTSTRIGAAVLIASAIGMEFLE